MACKGIILLLRYFSFPHGWCYRILVFWDVKLCSDVDRFRRFEGLIAFILKVLEFDRSASSLRMWSPNILR
jgi:hypothetical protein